MACIAGPRRARVKVVNVDINRSLRSGLRNGTRAGTTGLAGKGTLSGRVLWCAGAALAGFLQAFPAAALSQELPFEVAAAVAEQAPLERFYDGTVEAVNQATVSAQTSGRIAEVYYDVDDYVEAGSPLVRFTDVEQQSDLLAAQAALKEAQARATEAEEEFRRAAGLYEAGSGSKRDFDQARAARSAASARVTAARSAVQAARQQVEYTFVRAPYAGIVTQRHVEAGESVGVGQPLMSGISLELLRVSVDLPQQIAAQFRKSKKAAVLTDEGRVVPVSLTIFPFADPGTNTFTARLDLPEGQFGLYPGMFVKVAFVVGEARRLLVPTAALIRRSEVTGAYVIGPDRSVRFRQLRTGNAYGDKTEVLSGLSEGELVAIDPVAAAIYVKSGMDES